MDELDRILEADDVERAGGIEVVDHRGERRGLAGPGRAGDEDHALMVVAELLDERWQSELIERRHLVGNCAKGGPQTGLLAKDVDAKASPVGRYVGEIEVVSLAQNLEDRKSVV